MKNLKNAFFALFVFSVLLFSSCAEQGPSGPAGAPGVGLVSTSFQDGAYPAAAYAGTRNARLTHLSPDSVSTGAFSAGIFGTGNYWRQLLGFDVSYLSGTGLSVEKAFITFTTDSVLGTTTITAYALNRNWVEDQVTWNSYSTGNLWTAAGGDFGEAVSTTLEVSAAGTYTLEISAALVQNWIDKPSDNYGVLIKAANETVTSNRFHGSVRTDLPVSERPRLTVYYTAP